MAIWRGEKKLDSSEINREIKAEQKDNKRLAKIFAKKEKADEKFNNLKHEPSELDDFFKLDSHNEDISKLSNKEFLMEQSQVLNKTSEDSLELSRKKILAKNPFKLLSNLNNERKIMESKLKDQAEQLGFTSAIVKGVKELFGGKAKEYAYAHRSDNSAEAFQEAVENIKNKYKVEDIFVHLSNLSKHDVQSGFEFENLFDSAFKYANYKTAMWIAELEDNEKITEKVKSALYEILGQPKGLTKNKETNRHFNNFAKNIDIDKYSNDDFTFKLITGFNTYHTYTTVNVLLKYDDVMAFYKDMNNYNSLEPDKKLTINNYLERYELFGK